MGGGSPRGFGGLGPVAEHSLWAEDATAAPVSPDAVGQQEADSDGQDLRPGDLCKSSASKGGRGWRPDLGMERWEQS